VTGKGVGSTSSENALLRPKLQEIDRNHISRSESASSANLERLKIWHDPAAVLLYGNGRVG
jgi:hypothetical protein